MAEQPETTMRTAWLIRNMTGRRFGTNRFVAEKLGLEREEYTTQISNYDNLSAIFDAMKRINTVMIDMNRDFWQYISMEYFQAEDQGW